MNKYNRNNLIKVDLIYKLVTIAVFYPFFLIFFKFALKLSNVEYLTNEYIYKFLTKPTTMIFVFLTVVLLCILATMEQQLVYAGYEVLKKERKRASYLTENAVWSMKNNLKLRNLPIFLISGVSVLTLNMSLVFHIIINLVNIKTYFLDGFRKYADIRFAVLGPVLILLVLTFLGLFTSCVMYDRKCSFREAFCASMRITCRNPLKVFGGIVLYNLMVLGVILLLYVIITALVAVFVELFGIEHAGMVIYLTAMRFFSDGMNIVLTLVSVPCSFLYTIFLYGKLGGSFTGKRDEENEEYREVINVIVLVAVIMDCFFFFTLLSDNSFKLMDALDIATITAHRGSSREYPENSMAAFEQAVRDLTDCIELDVRQTADGGFVIMHDENLKRTTGVDRIVGELTKEQICSLKVGSDETVPSLEEVLEFARYKPVKLNIELKTASTDVDYAEGIYEILAEYGVLDSCYITSTDYDILREMKMLDGDIETGYILSVAMGNYYDMEYVDFFSVNYRFVTSTMIYLLHQRGKEIHVWTLDSEEDIIKYANMGADSIITDDPLFARKVVYSKDTPDILRSVMDYIFSN
ncbi:MAG: glycerophosphoryl diester phosphodiesterase membrane domain-containing protein [Alistipes sp.]|nr:glycerophosphoryl diester phosphodiesterase membrane domain-containing protein [Alistipes sp.]